MIKISNIDKYYFKNKSNEIHVLNDVNLELDNVGFTTILGPSGSGKSTLLHVIGGLDKAKGKIAYDETEFNKICTNYMDIHRNKLVGYVFQNYHLLPDLTVYQNLKLQLELIGVDDPDEVDQRIHTCLKAIGMEKYKRRNVTALSGGQQQRVAIARALVKGSKIIIADEPTGNLDSKNSIEVMNILKALSKKCLVLLVTHDQTLAKHYSDRIIRISDGKIISDEKNEGNDFSLEDNKEVIFLDQYQEKVLSKENQQVSLFSNGDSDVKIRIVVDNNVIYVESLDGKPIKVAGEFGGKTIKEKKPEVSKSVDENNIDIDFDYEIKKSFSKKVKNFFYTLKDALLSFFLAKKKTWLVYVSFAFIGALLCCCLSSINYSTTYDTNVVKLYPADAIKVDAKKSTTNSAYGYTLEYSEVYEILDADSGAIGIVDVLDEVNFYYQYVGSRQLSYTPQHQCYATTPGTMGFDMDLKNNEIAIPTVLAEELIEFYKEFGISTVDKLLNTKFSIKSPVFSGDVVIKEIYEGDNNTILFSCDKYYLVYTFNAMYGGGIKFRVLEENEKLLNFEELPKYTGLIPVYVSNNFFEFTRKTQDNREIIGRFDSEEFEMVFLNIEDYSKYIRGYIANSGINVMPYEENDLELIEGTLPQNDKQAVVPDLLITSLSIGDSYNSYEVCGFFKSEYPRTASFIYSTTKSAYLEKFRNIYARNEDPSEVCFYVNDYEKFQAFMEQKGYETIPLREAVLQEASLTKINESALAIIISIAISIVMVVFIFFMSRSKMLHSIYSIGVYRALGAKKSKIHFKYLLDSIILATFTAVFGFLLMYAFVCYADNYIPSLSVKIEYALAVIGSLYVVMILASLLPIAALLRKTPIEILGKYDI